MGETLLESRPDRYIFSDWPKFRAFEFIEEVVVMIEQFLFFVSITSD